MRRTEGRAFALFTSEKLMARTAKAVRRTLADEDYTLLVQGEAVTCVATPAFRASSATR